MADKKTIAVVFGGRSVEHDVSILTGLQFLEALDSSRYVGLPVYIDPLGQWWTGALLTSRTNYPVSDTSGLTPLTLDLASATATGQPAFIKHEKGLFGTKISRIDFDMIVPAIHGSNGEDGSLQGLLEFANIPFAGSNSLASGRTMDKLAAKRAARANGLNVVPELVVERPMRGTFLDDNDLTAALKDTLGDAPYPLIVKPRRLGSSVGVSRAENFDELMAALLKVFKFDREALVEPCVTPLVEYNIAVRRRADGSVATSAIERPLSGGELLDFTNKYRRGAKGGTKGGTKQASSSEGMASLNREIDPKDLSDTQEAEIRTTAEKLAIIFGLNGSARIDFLCNGDTDEIWFNEVNTIPGSFAYFLWEAASERLSFLDLTHHMIEEGFAAHVSRTADTDVQASGARLFGTR